MIGRRFADPECNRATRIERAALFVKPATVRLVDGRRYTALA